MQNVKEKTGLFSPAKCFDFFLQAGAIPPFRPLPFLQKSCMYLAMYLAMKLKTTETAKTYRGKALIADPIYQYILFTAPSPDLPPEITEQTLIRRRIDAANRQIDQLVYDLYGLTPEEIAVVEESVR